MKHIIYCALGLICLLVLAVSVRAQVYEGVAVVYYQSFAYPERFNKYLADNNNALLDKRFYSCLNFLEQTWIPVADKAIEDCKIHQSTLPGWYEKCIAEKESIKMKNWLVGLRLVLNGTMTWAKTPIGGISMGAKFSWPTGPDAFVQEVNKNYPASKKNFLCQFKDN